MSTARIPDRRPRRRPTSDETVVLEADILEAAITTFLDRGFDGATMDAVARAAGITRRTLYARYRDKSELFARVIQTELGRLPEGTTVETDTGSFADALMNLARSAYARAVDQRNVRLGILLMHEAARFSELIPKQHHLARLPHMQLLIDLLRDHPEDHKISPPDVELAAEHFLTMVASHPARLASFGLHHTDELRDRYLSHAVDLFLHGIGHRGEPRP